MSTDENRYVGDKVYFWERPPNTDPVDQLKRKGKQVLVTGGSPMEEIVAQFDANGYGKMSNSVMKKLLLLFPGSTEEAVDRVVTEMDGDGVIGFDQFIGFLCKQEIRYTIKCYARRNDRGVELILLPMRKMPIQPGPLAPAVAVPETHEVNILPPPSSSFLNKEVFCLPEAFGRFDTDGDGKISAMGVKSVLSSLGRVISLEEAQRITAQIDKVDGDGLVDLKDLAGLFCKRDIRVDVDGPSVFDPIPEVNALTDNYEKWMKRAEILLPITASGAHATACILSKATSAAGFIACVMVMLLRGTRWEAKAATRVLAKFAAAACMAAVLTSLANDLPRDYAWIVVVLAFVIPLGAVSFA